MNEPRKNPHAVILGRRGGRVGGLSKSKAKIAAVRRNGTLGGRPRKDKSLNPAAGKPAA